MANEDTRDFMRGYLDGANGEEHKSPSVMQILSGALLPGIDPVNTDNYDDGYKKGAEDRQNR